MSRAIQFYPKGVCCKQIDVIIEDGKVADVTFTGGCNGNLQGLSSLIKGMDCHEVIARLKGIDCKGKGTSCPDQLCQCLQSITL